MTVEEYLDFVYRLKQCKLPQEEHIRQVCTMVGLTDVYGRIIRNLSKGYRQRVGLAQALIGNPDILILDEPTRGIDVGAKYDIYCLVNEMVASGKSVIMISSEMPELLGMCDRIYVMNEGKMLAELDAKTATQESIMSHIIRSTVK